MIPGIGLLAKFGPIGSLYRKVDSSIFRGRLPGGAPSGNGGRPMRGTRARGGMGAPRRFPPGPSGFAAGMATQYAGERVRSAIRPPAANGAAANGNGNGMMPSSRDAILWVESYPYPPKGYVRNKSAYYRMDPQTGQIVHIPRGAVWRRMRRTNPLNPRALDRAITRIGSAKRAEDTLKRVTIKCKKCRKVSCSCR